MSNRRGFTLIELLVAMASATVLMAGLSSALYIAARGMDLDDGGSARRARADAAVGRLLADARTATRMRTLSSGVIEFDVPDRTGDNVADRLRYAWDGMPGSLLTRELNGGSPITVLQDVRSLSFDSATRTSTVDTTAGSTLTTWPRLGGVLQPAASTTMSIAVSRPTTMVPGDLMVAVLCVEETSTGDIDTPSGWTQVLLRENSGEVTLGVWTRTLMASDPSSFTWSWNSNKDAIGWILVLSNHHRTEPIAATEVAYSTGKSSHPTTPSVTAATGDSLVLRVGAFDKDIVKTVDVTGLPGHTDVWVRSVDNKIAGACGYAVPVGPGAVGTAAFDNKNNSDYVVATIVITPRPAVAP
ncbi:hypothetical protein Pla108_22340 [Botrimarina colliarenosi]|uniref:Uncharacterized protein n=1 Tax=Botrimarina colliarenosi TaxID=2528001 RepID=A0A5C6AF82_9BACT|nr:prepilin-type N-terminal cleavage/methylation domain-containing protein [Botrimarina colliarenosi]TWT98077.1 hypothetical protein Pla108_22340 [Botrimarina colliarenosi]